MRCYEHQSAWLYSKTIEDRALIVERDLLFATNLDIRGGATYYNQTWALITRFGQNEKDSITFWIDTKEIV